MKRLFPSLVCLLLAFAALAPAARAADFKLAGVNMDRLFNDYYKTGQANDRLDKQREAYRQYIVEQQVEIKKLEDTYKQLRDDSMSVAYSPEAQKQKADEAATLDAQRKAKMADVQAFNKDKMKVLMEKFQQERADIVVEINKTVGTLSEQEGYQLVLDTSGLTSNQIPTVVYLKADLDITERVLAKLNAGHEQEVADRKAAAKKAEEAEKAHPTGNNAPTPNPIALPDHGKK